MNCVLNLTFTRVHTCISRLSLTDALKHISVLHLNAAVFLSFIVYIFIIAICTILTKYQFYIYLSIYNILIKMYVSKFLA